MVSRKPVPSRNGPSSQAAGNASLPYPVTPISPRNGDGTFDEQNPSAENVWSSEGVQNATTTPNQQRTFVPNASEINEGWVDAAVDRNNAEDKSALPAPLRIHKDKSTESVGNEPQIPASLRPGGSSLEITPRSSWESDRSFEDIQNDPEIQRPPSRPPPEKPPVSNNPFHRAASAERAPQPQFAPQDDSSSNIWAELAENPTPSTSKLPPSQLLGELTLDNQDNLPIPPVSQPDAVPSEHRESALISFDPAEDYQKELRSSPFTPAAEDPWQGEEHYQTLPQFTEKGKGKEVILPPEAEENPFREPQLEGPVPPPSAPTPSRSAALERKIFVPEDVAERQRSETYQIKHINWLDSNSQELRTSPILIQNKNGPCPLLALVNALSLSTPSNAHTALIETLRVREQVSLGLLLDAVFDELMSGRRGDAAQELPDVSELYSFLITLHTGMNVNPRFLPVKRKEQSLMDGFENEVPLTIHDFRKPGTFEHTKEMLLYSTFSVPLIHGWIPPMAHPAFQALERSAQSYEDAQNLLFREEELEDKLQASGLSQEEQQMLEDIASIKFFLSSSATQLTGFGLDTIRETLKPGEIVILFRNDHFSTLYKHPRTGQLLHLVTDAGYAGHQEVVWESLVDVKGEGSEFFSGDFRPVGHNDGGGSSQQQAFETGGQGDAEWTTVSKKGHKSVSAQASTPSGTNRPLPEPPEENEYNLPTTRSTEQEDADLALAMQLQEEEEDRSRRSAAARQRENELSKAYLSSQNISTQHLNTNTSNAGSTSSTARPASNTARQSQPPSTSQTVRPLLPPRRDNPRPPVHRETDQEPEDDAPPSYEQAAKAEPYHPPPDQPPRPDYNDVPAQSSSSLPHGQNPSNGRPRGQSAYSLSSANVAAQGQRRRSGAPSSSSQDPSVQGILRRRSAGLTSSSEERRDKDCVVM